MIRQHTMGTYDRIASDFARLHATMPQTLIDDGRRFLALVGPEAQILDVGCGAGRDMAWLEAQGAHVTGLDLSRGMLAQARLQVRGTLVAADMCHLPFPDGAFAGVWCMAASPHLPKKEAPRARREMRRAALPRHHAPEPARKARAGSSPIAGRTSTASSRGIRQLRPVPLWSTRDLPFWTATPMGGRPPSGADLGTATPEVDNTR